MRVTLKLSCASAVAVLLLGVLVSVSAASHATTHLVSVGPGSFNGNFHASFDGVSADGTRVLFETAEKIEPADTDASTDIYERSGHTATTRVSTGSNGGNGGNAIFAGASADATRVFFTTTQKLEPDDTDTQMDVYERFGSTTTRVSTGSAGGNGAFAPTFRGTSADGTRVFFETSEALEPGDTDTQVDIYERFGSTTTRVSTGSTGGNGAFGAVTFRGTSADGTRVFFETSEALEPGDTDTQIDVYEHFGSTTTLISTGSAGGNGAFAPTLRGTSADGTRVFFETSEALEPGDTDTQVDIYERFGSTTTRVSTGSAGGNGAFAPTFRGTSADGTRVFFSTAEAIESADSDSAIDIYERFGSATTLISTGSVGGNGPFDATFRGASTDGTHVFLETDEQLQGGDPDAVQDVYERFGSTTTLVSTGSSGGSGSATFRGASADGTRVFFDTSESLGGSDTDGSIDIYERSDSITSLISIGSSGGNGAFDANFRGTSTDGRHVFFETVEQLEAADTDTARDVYESFRPDTGPSVTAGYPRPVGASPVHVSLLPAYKECASPNVSHAMPFADTACNPPGLVSDHLTVGTPSANGKPAKSNGSVLVTVLPGTPGGAEDADASLKVSITDVRNQDDLTDYTGELRLSTSLRITDKANGAGETAQGTTVDLPLNVTVPCAATGDTTIGGSCSIATTLDSVLGSNAAREGKRAIYDLIGGVDVFDGGADGDADTPAGDEVFATDGFFVP